MNTTNGTAIPYNPQPAPHAQTTFRELLDRSHKFGHTPTRPLDFPSPHVRRGVRVKVLAYNPNTGERKLIGVIHRAEFLTGSGVGGGGGVISTASQQQNATATPRQQMDPTLSPGNAGGNGAENNPPIITPRSPVPATPPPPPPPSLPTTNLRAVSSSHYGAYWPQRRLQDAIYGCVIACTVLIRHVGEAADAAARAAGYEPGHPLAPIVWEITDEFVAIKQVEWRRVHAMRGRLLEDPIKEIAAMQLIGNSHPNVLGSVEVLQDNEHLYSIMPYCRGGDLFGVVLDVAEKRQANEAIEGAGGMSEPVARYWFRQLLLGLHHLQSKGICHRDLSLENILVDIHHCLVIDMGMCLRVPYHCDGGGDGKAVDVEQGTDRRLIVPMGTCGKKNYMSPEVYENKDNFDGFAVDLWSAVSWQYFSLDHVFPKTVWLRTELTHRPFLFRHYSLFMQGIILYIMVTGFPPYDIPTTEDERYDIICQGGLMRQLRAWDSK